MLLSLGLLAAREAYRIRLYAVQTYGAIIHEFDPWFNFRAAQYLAENGYQKFFKWLNFSSLRLIYVSGTTTSPGTHWADLLVPLSTPACSLHL